MADQTKQADAEAAINNLEIERGSEGRAFSRLTAYLADPPAATGGHRGNAYRTGTKFVRDANGQWVADTQHPQDTPRTSPSPRILGRWWARKEKRAAIAARVREESRAMNTIKRKIRKRQDIGAAWDGTPANDNRIDWPLSRAMLQDGNEELLRVAIKYRAIHEQAMAQPLLGEGAAPVGELQILHRLVDRGDGTMVNKGAVVLKSANPTEYPAQRATPTSSESKQRAAPVPKPWCGDRMLNETMDARALLVHLQWKLGRLCDPLEMAVIDGETIQKVGGASGMRGQNQANGAGKALVYTGLLVVRDELQALSIK